MVEILAVLHALRLLGGVWSVPAAIYSLTQTPDGDTAALRLVAVSIAIAMAALIASEILARRATSRLHGY